MEGVLLTQNTPDWENAWEWLGSHPINKDLDEPKVAENQGEMWQYMGSYYNDGKLVTDFRHRVHPTTNNVSRLTYRHESCDEVDFLERKKIT